MEEIKLNMENLSATEREQLMRLVEKANKKESKVWKPREGEIYYSINSSGYVFETTACIEAFPGVHEDRFSIGNCFKTQEEAEFALEKQRVIVELERFAKEHNKNDNPICLFDLRYDKGRQRVVSYAENPDYYAGSVFFGSREASDAAIKAIGEGRLKKYYFGVE